MRPLSNVEELIERTLFHSVQRELVLRGYLPDIEDTATYPDSQVGIDAWKAAVTNIVQTRGFCVEVFGHSSNLNKGVQKSPRIVFVPEEFEPGAIGGDQTYFYEREGNSYTAQVRPPQSVDYFMSVHVIGETAEQVRLMNAIIGLTLPRRGYLPFYDDPEKKPKMFIENMAFRKYTDNSKGIVEHIRSFKIPDLYDIETYIAEENIAPITEIRMLPVLNDIEQDEIIITN